ncbi:MAG: hypothetical protein QGI75_08545 [Phycisphaerales bacterium]|nr:hypothetical protein [Phycisphaerales bacterium]MDP6890439.1 hypothetical protein [Phycisphaerales bacterium]
MRTIPLGGLLQSGVGLRVRIEHLEEHVAIAARELCERGLLNRLVCSLQESGNSELCDSLAMDSGGALDECLVLALEPEIEPGLLVG